MAAPQTIIRLSVTKILQSAVLPESGGNRLQISVTETENIDPKIFIFQADVDSEFSPENLAIYWAVASVPELSSLPADAANQDEPFFRLATLDLVFATPMDLEAFHSKTLLEVRQLQRANDIFIDPANAETICMEISGGDVTVIPCPTSSSSSSG